MATGKTVALTRRTFVSKVMSLPFSMLFRSFMLSRFSSKEQASFNFMSAPTVFLEPPKIKSDTVSIVSPSICHEVMGLNAMILVRDWEGIQVRLEGRGKKNLLKPQHLKTKIMASGPITSWQIDGETMETVTDFILRGSKITADGDCGLGRKIMTNLDSI